MTDPRAITPSYATAGQRGLTLVEVMIALTLSIVLLGSVLQIYLSSKQTYRVDDALSRMQEGGRIALDVLTYDIRMAGYQGCADPVVQLTTSVIATGLAPMTDLFTNAIAGTQGDDTPPTTTVNNSDSITLRYGDPTTATAIGAGSTAATLAIASNPLGYKTNDYLLASDCTSADIFQATNAGTITTSIEHAAAKNNPSTTKIYAQDLTPPALPAPPDSVVMRFMSNTYSVLDTGRTNERGAPVRALFRTDVNGASTEIVDGVEYLEVTYCERLANGNLRCVPADDASLDMSRVVSVRLGLLMVSDDAVLDADDTRDYPLVDTTISHIAAGAADYDASDRRMRRVFTTTVRLRNRR